MDNIFTITTPRDAAMEIARKAKSMRLRKNFSRKTLAAKAGVSEGSLKRFETTGEVALVSLLRIAFVLGCMKDFEGVFHEMAEVSIEEIIGRAKTERQRGRA